MKRVRLRFVIALLCVLPFLAHSIWDYFEIRRLNARLDAIAQSGAPIATTRFQPVVGPMSDADRFYRAAAVLVGNPQPSAAQMAYRVTAALREGQWAPDLVAELRTSLDEHHDALAWVDRAAPLPFDGFSPGWTSPYLVSGLMALSRLCELRAVDRALAGDGDAAFESFYADVRLERVMGRPPHLQGLAFVVERAQPSAPARTRVAQALADIDREDRLKQEFVLSRSAMLTIALPGVQRRTSELAAFSLGPWSTHMLVDQLDTYAAIIDAAQKPEGERMQAINAVGRFPGTFRSNQSRAVLESFTKRKTADVERIRCARRLVAGEVVDCHF